MHDTTVAALYLDSLSNPNNKICLANSGALIAYSGQYTGRKPDWKHFVKNEIYDKINPNTQNKTISETVFRKAKMLAVDYIENISEYNNLYRQETSYIIDSYINWHPRLKCFIRFHTTNPYHALFFKNMTIACDKMHEADSINLTIYDAGVIPYDKDNEYDKEGLVGFNLRTDEIVILGTEYAGEIKKGMFTFMMYKMPLLNYLPLHSSANIGLNNDVTLFFGLSNR